MPSGEENAGNQATLNCRPVRMVVEDTRPFICLKLDGVRLRALCDAGTILSYLGPPFRDRLRSLLLPSSSTIVGATGETSLVIGSLPLMFNVDGRRELLTMRVVPGLDYECILGRDFLRTFDLTLDLR